jgi:N-methylhydantoinase B
MARRKPDTIALALYQGFFASVAEDMGATLMRTAHSPNIKERLDHSCAVFDARARLVAQAAHIPVHLGSMPQAVEAAAERAPFQPGDVVIVNDPYRGGTHLPDVTLVSPVFTGRGRDPDYYVASRAHHADIGGAAPGSMPLAREIYEEGFRAPPVFLVRAGRVQEDVLSLLLANVRTPDERRADLSAQMGAQKTGEARLMALAKRLGARPLRDAADALMDHAERCVRAALADMPRGMYTFEDMLDDDGLGTRDIRIRVAVMIGQGRCVIDFKGTHDQVAGPVNAVEAVAKAASYYAVRCVIGGEFPVNDGAFRPIEVHAPLGSVVNARPPAAVSAGNVETSQRIVDTVLGALAKAAPDRVPPASSGTMNNLLIGGVDPRTGKPFAYYETLGGGHGAGPTWHGESAMQAHMTNTRNTPVEALEHAYPLIVRSTRIRRGSGGLGVYQGGSGIEREIELTAPARVTLMTERRARGPYGLKGGEAGAAGRNAVMRAGGRTEKLPGKTLVSWPAGAALSLARPGGGGAARPRRNRTCR